MEKTLYIFRELLNLKKNDTINLNNEFEAYIPKNSIKTKLYVNGTMSKMHLSKTMKPK